MIKKIIFLCVFSVTASILQIAAQPGLCPPPFDSERRCQPEYQSEDLVFIGQVNARDNRISRAGDREVLGVDLVETVPIKGTVSKELRIYLDQSLCRKAVEVGKRYIFTAHRSKVTKSSAVVSGRWSTALDPLSKDEMAGLIERIRSVAAGDKQPSVTGKIVRYTADPFDIYEFRGRSLLTKLGYDPKYATPIEGVRLVAKNVKGKTFETVSDAAGEFVFESLPSESYEIAPVLPTNTIVNAFQYSISPFQPEYRPVMEGRLFFPVYNKVCGEDIRFNVRVSK